MTCDQLSVVKKKPLLTQQVSSLSSTSSSSSSSRRVGEVAGVTLVECAAVCCCPCALFHFLALTVYRLPAGLCRKAVFRLKNKRSKSRLDLKMKEETGGRPTEVVEDMQVLSVMRMEIGDEVAELEEEMWERFNGAGFWRSASQRTKLSSGSRRFQSLSDLSPSQYSTSFSGRFEFDATCQS